jgi:hypothetical protein
MRELSNPKLIYTKGVLFFAGGALAALGVILEAPNWRTITLLLIAIWCFARAYYFVFYVIQHYVDPQSRIAGLGAFVLYLLRRRRARGPRP